MEGSIPVAGLGAATLPATAPALRFCAFGGPDVLTLEDLTSHPAGPGEALIAVHAASINPSDVKNVAGRMRQTVPPRTPGRDFAGIVVDGPADWQGAEVWGTGGDLGFTRDGSHAALLRLPVAALARKPANLSFAQAGAVGVNYVTAALGLDYAALKPGETVLVLGASGGVGGAACAIARQRGATVIAAQRGRPAPDQPAAQTAHRFIDLNVISPGEAIQALTGNRGVDVVFDCVGNIPLTTSALGALAMRGRVVIIAGTPGEKLSLELIPFYRREARLIGVDSLKRGAAECATLLEALRPGFETGAFPAPAIAHSFPLDQARAAYGLVNSGTRGRVILAPAPNSVPTPDPLSIAGAPAMPDTHVTYTDANLTEAVLARIQPEVPARTKEIMTALLKHAHAFVRDVKLTPAEWDAGIKYLSAMGPFVTDKRNEWILLSDVTGVTMLVDAITHASSEGVTETTVLGPFHRENPPVLKNGDNISVGLTGEMLEVRVVIADAAGTPIQGAQVDVWHADKDGGYDSQIGDGNTHMMRGRFVTGADGVVHFWTVNPSCYPVPHDGPAGQVLAAMGRGPMRPAHVHFWIKAPGYRDLITHIFADGDKYLYEDAVFGVKASLVVDFEAKKKAGTSDHLELTYEFRIPKA
jgi:NADPH:quinone reductase-like Zn-dependent oxidoreductase/protocatechuate 3,4-dioxygenase beta subunit